MASLACGSSFLIPFSIKRNQGPLEKWLAPGQGLGKYKDKLGTFRYAGKEERDWRWKNIGAMSEGLGGQLGWGFHWSDLGKVECQNNKESNG